MKSKTLLLALVLLIGGCSSLFGPRYKTVYSYSPAVTQLQRNCVMIAKTAKDSCQRSERRNCLDRAEYEYRDSLDEYYREKRTNPSRYISPPSRSSYSSRCNDYTAECELGYVENYKLCGLKVTSSQVCVRNCDKIPPTE